MTSAEKDEAYGPVVAVMASRSDPDKEYEVRFKGGGYSCQCKYHCYAEYRLVQQRITFRK